MLCFFGNSQDKLATHCNLVFMVDNKHKIFDVSKISSDLTFNIYPTFAEVNDINKSTYTFTQAIDDTDKETMILYYKCYDEKSRSCIFEEKCINNNDTIIAIIYQDRCFIYFKNKDIDKLAKKNVIDFYYQKYFYAKDNSIKRRDITPIINIIPNNTNLISKDIIPESDDSKAKIWPNPTSVYLNINCGEFCPEKIEIWDNAGRVIYKSNYSDRINISQYRAGTYFISMISQKEVITKSFIKL
jgi:hypothetical protein